MVITNWDKFMSNSNLIVIVFLVCSDLFEILMKRHCPEKPLAFSFPEDVPRLDINKTCVERVPEQTPLVVNAKLEEPFKDYYSQKNFREERIDGTSLPLLTEEHLTNSLSMKLGPALKLKANIARRLGHCAICLHCVHCHGASSLGPGTGSGGASSAGNRPSSTGN